MRHETGNVTHVTFCCDFVAHFDRHCGLGMAAVRLRQQASFPPLDPASTSMHPCKCTAMPYNASLNTNCRPSSSKQRQPREEQGGMMGSMIGGGESVAGGSVQVAMGRSQMVRLCTVSLYT